ncbi:MAG: type II toxin-antitoxin system Phd/YefM family antitoxin [bacterium]
MKLSEAVKPISYFKSHASEVIRDVVEKHETVVITLNGEAKAIIQDIREFEKMQDSLAILKILAQSRKNLEEGKSVPVREAFRNIREKIKDLKDNEI